MSGWRAERLPAVRDRMVRQLPREAERAAEMVERATAAGVTPELVAGAEAAPELWRRLTALLKRARLWWLAPDACRMATEAGAERSELDQVWMPADAGLVAGERPLARFDPALVGGLVLRAPDRMVDYGRQVPVDAIAWRRGVDEVEVHLLCKSRRLPWPLLGTPMPLTPLQDARLPLPLVRGLTRTMSAAGITTDNSVYSAATTLQSIWGMIALTGAGEAGGVSVVTGEIDL